MPYEIKSVSNLVLYKSDKASNAKEALEEAVENGANLRGANLRGANLGDANLGDANLGDAYLGDAYLGGANLGGADLRGADLRGAYLGDANLRGANLGGADLRGAYLTWSSHALLAEILKRASGDDIDKRKVAGLIAISTDWCWEQFEEMKDDPLFGWAINSLAEYRKEGDVAPEIIAKAAEKLEDNETHSGT